MVEPVALNAWFRLATRCESLRAGEPCGDRVWHRPIDTPAGPGTGIAMAIIDGLGHGAQAAQAADAAAHVLDSAPQLELPALMARIDAGLVATRGAAIGLARIEPAPNGWRLAHAGIGNTRTLRWRAPSILRLSSRYGIVGGGRPAAVEVTYTDLQPGDWLLMFSDGLDEMLTLPVCLPEWQRDPDTLCAHLGTRWRAAPDDVGLAVLQVGER